MLESLQFHLRRFALHTGVQRCNTNALQNWSGQNSFPTALCCSARQAHSRHCVTETTPMQICSSYRCAVMQHRCTGQGRIASLLFSALLQNRLSACLSHCNYTLGDLLFIQVCNAATSMLRRTGQGKMHFPLFNFALQNRLTAATVSMQLHLWRFALHTGVHHCRPV